MRRLPLTARQPGDAALHFAWGNELRELASVAHMRKMVFIDKGPILTLTCEQYDTAAALAPQNADYALKAAYCRVQLFEERPDGGQTLGEARTAVARANALAPGDTLLAELWGEALIDRASDKKVAPEDALAFLREADAVYANIIPHAPMEKVRATVPYFLRWRGQVAILTACRISDQAEAEKALARANAYYEQACGMDKDGLRCFGDWAEALDPDGKPLADPTFAAVLLRAKLRPLLAEQGSSNDPIVGAYTLMDLCQASERLARYVSEPGEREAVLRQGEMYCEQALREAHEAYRPRLQESAGRIKAGLAALAKTSP